MILVTGGCGYIGSHFVLACRDAGRPVVVIDDLSTGHRTAIAPDIPFLWGDFADQDLLTEAKRRYGVTQVVHFAAKISVAESMRAPRLYLDVNARRTTTLIAICRLLGMDELVFSSTAAVYGVPAKPVVDEATPTRPISPYGTSKLLAERALSRAAREGPLRHVALRYFNVAGADPQLRSGPRAKNAEHLFGRLVDVALGRLHHLEVYGTDYPTRDGTAVRDFIHVSDLAQAHLSALDHLAGGGKSVTLNCGYGTGTTVLEARAVMEEVANRTIPLTMAPRRAGDIPQIVANPARLMRTLEWVPRHAALDSIAQSALAFEITRERLEARRRA